MNKLENVMRPFVSLFVEGAVFTGSCTLFSVLSSIGDRKELKYLGLKSSAAIAGSVAWISYAAIQKLAEFAIKQFGEQYFSKFKFFSMALSLVTSVNLTNLVLVELKLIPEPVKAIPYSNTKMRDEDLAKAEREELVKVLAAGVVCTYAFKQQSLFKF